MDNYINNANYVYLEAGRITNHNNRIVTSYEYSDHSSEGDYNVFIHDQKRYRLCKFNTDNWSDRRHRALPRFERSSVLSLSGEDAVSRIPVIVVDTCVFVVIAHKTKSQFCVDV